MQLKQIFTIVTVWQWRGQLRKMVSADQDRMLYSCTTIGLYVHSATKEIVVMVVVIAVDYLWHLLTSLPLSPPVPRPVYSISGLTPPLERTDEGETFTCKTPSDLKPFTRYSFKVSAVNAAGAGPFSVAVEGTTEEDGECWSSSNALQLRTYRAIHACIVQLKR